jgi:Haem-binding domain
MNKKLMIIIGLLLVIQLYPVNRDNPQSDPQLEIKLQPEVKQIVEKACYDCHSNKSNWPWYSYVAPVSWFVASHVEEGRHEMNFSVWQDYTPKRKSKKLGEIVEEIEEGEMPLAPYKLTHSQANLSDGEVATLINWAKSDSLYRSEKDHQK